MVFLFMYFYFLKTYFWVLRESHDEVSLPPAHYALTLPSDDNMQM